MKVSARAIIIKDGKLLTMFRRQRLACGAIKEFYTIPGGKLDINETSKQAVKRELKEEMGLDIKIEGYVGHDYSKTIGRAIFYYCSADFEGLPKLSGEELAENCEDNYYEPRWVYIKDLDNVFLLGKGFVKQVFRGKYALVSDDEREMNEELDI